MNPNLTVGEKMTLITAVRQHHPELANWLERRTKITLTKTSFNYGQTILDRGHGSSIPQVGIVMGGVVEVQGDVQHLSVVDKTLVFPLALRGVGETIGEVEHSAFRLYNNLWRRPWTAYAGMQSFYITPLRGSKDGYLGQFKKLMKSRAALYQTTIANIDSKDIDDECSHILGEISLKRLLSITSVWQPDRTELKDQYNLTFADRSWERDNNFKSTQPGRKSILLYMDILAAIQGARVTFRQFSEQELKETMPWDTTLLPVWDRASLPRFDKFLVLGIHITEPSRSGPFIILPHFYCNPYGSPTFDFARNSSITGQFNTDLVTTMKLVKAYSDRLGTNIPSQSILLEAVSGHEVIAIVTGKDQQPRIFSSAGHSPQQIIAKIGRDLKLTDLRKIEDLNMLGMLGKASLLVFSA